MGPPASECSANERLACLEAVLSSRCFERSEQLRKFLGYICEMERTGRSQEITEYSIGVAALGRREDFSPADDSIVRNRAYMLRKKLEEYYDEEARDAPLRIELPKGSYTPRFVSTAAAAPHALTVEPEPEHPVPVVAPSRVSRPWFYGPLIGLLVGAFLSSGAFWLSFRGRIVPVAPPYVQAAWRGILEPGSEVVISVATPAQSYIREFATPGPRTRNYYPVDPAIAEWYRRQHPGTPTDVQLFQVPTFNSPLWGDAAGALRIAEMLRGFGVESDLLAERLVTPPVFRNRNVVMLGNPEYSPTIRRLMTGFPLQVAVDPSTAEHEVVEVDAHGKIVGRFVPVRDPHTLELSEVFGLITSLPAEGDGEQHYRYLLFSGISSAGTEAAAQFFTSPSQLEKLAEHLRLRPGESWPNKLQVLVRSTTNRTVALSFSYETHRIAP